MSKKLASNRNLWLLPVLVGAGVIVVLAGVFWFAFGGSDSESTAETEQESSEGGVVDIVEPENSDQIDLTHVEQRDPADPLATGDVDAPVTLVVFSDYQCPYCAAWSNDTLPVMMEYVDEGDLRIEWRDLNVYGAFSEQASKASFAAGMQDKFWEFHDELFLDGEIRSESQLTEEAMLDIADELGLDAEQFTEDMRSDVVDEHIQANEALGTELGAYSTPAFVLGGEPMLGAQPTNVFVDAMDDALAAEHD